MKKIILILVVAIAASGCKKTNVTPTIKGDPKDSIYLVSSQTLVVNGLTSLPETYNYSYDNQNKMTKQSYIFVSGTNNFLYTYNTDGTISSISANYVGDSADNLTVDYTYSSQGTPVSEHVSTSPQQLDDFTNSGSLVQRIDFYEADITNKGKNYTTFSYDGAGNILSSKTFNTSSTNATPADSSKSLYQYNNHKSAFFYSNGKFVLGRLSYVPLGGSNDFSQQTTGTYNSVPFVVINYTTTYNNFDMPIEKKGTDQNGNTFVIDYTYVEVHK